MNKAELVDALSRVYFDGNRDDATKALNAVLETITHQTAIEGRIVLTGFGTFEKVERPPRQVLNPHTGRTNRIKRSPVPRFSPGSDLKAYIAGDKKVPRSARKPPAKKSPTPRPAPAAAAAAKQLVDSQVADAVPTDTQAAAEPSKAKPTPRRRKTTPTT